jgi:acyl CoA:acetate/3-ketoacid CoA transferase
VAAVTAGRRTKVIAPEAAAQLMLDGDTLAVGGFVGIAVPEELLIALEKRFRETGGPRDLTLVFAAGQGDGGARGLNHLAYEGLIRRAIGAHWGLVPALGALALDGRIEAYCLPLGVLSHLYRETAAGRPGLITRVGLGTFVDPRLGGGRMNAESTEEVVRVIELEGEEFLFYPRRPIDVAFLRGTTADEEGSVTMEREAATLDMLSIAQATKNSGGIVIVQVERVTTRHLLSPREVRIPGILVDGVAEVTFNGERAHATGQSVLYITERCVLRLGDNGLELIEIAPGLDLERDVLAHMGFRPQIAPDLREMDAAIFTDAPLGLGERSPLTLDERVDYRADEDLVFINFEGLTLDTLEAAEELASFMGRRLRDLGRPVSLVVNYDNFELGREAAPRFFEMVREHERRYFLSSTRYSTDAFLRRKLGRAFADARLSQTIYRSFEESAHALGEHAARPRPTAKPRDKRA